MLGKGTFGKVFLCTKTDSKKDYAVKVMSKKKIIEKKRIVSVDEETKILSVFNNPFIVKSHFVFENKKNVYLVIDLMRGGDLFFHLKKMKRFNEN